jgi:hypothetical protein
MTEREYLIVQNMTKVTAARIMIREILANSDYGITSAKQRKILLMLVDIESRMRDMVEIAE